MPGVMEALYDDGAGSFMVARPLKLTELYFNGCS